MHPAVVEVVQLVVAVEEALLPAVAEVLLEVVAVVVHLVVVEESDQAVVGLQGAVSRSPWPDQVELERVVIAALVVQVPCQVDS